MQGVEYWGKDWVLSVGNGELLKDFEQENDTTSEGDSPSVGQCDAKA